MKTFGVIAIAAMLGLAGLAATSTVADARRDGGGFKGGGIFSGGGPRMSAPRMSAPRFSAQRFSGQRFSGPKFSGQRSSGQLFSNPGIGRPVFKNRAARVDGWKPPRKWSGNTWNGAHKWRGHKRRHYSRYPYYWSAPLIASSAYYGYYDDCAWLRRKAIQTSSTYWWNRYNACILEY
ncbi:MAG: hypothetical protein ACT4OU_13380 [Hyphomicrobium sp.]